MSEYKRLTSREVIKHSDGTSHVETFCHGHRYGRAAFPEKYGTSNLQEYEDYCEMIDRLAEYEDIGSPEEFRRLKAEVEKLRDRLQISPYGDDLIDQLEESLGNCRFQLEVVKAERDAAVNDLKTVCTSGEACIACKNCRNMGDEFPCAIGDWCGGIKWEWCGLEAQS